MRAIDSPPIVFVFILAIKWDAKSRSNFWPEKVFSNRDDLIAYVEKFRLNWIRDEFVQEKDYMIFVRAVE